MRRQVSYVASAVHSQVSLREDVDGRRGDRGHRFRAPGNKFQSIGEETNEQTNTPDDLEPFCLSFALRLSLLSHANKGSIQHREGTRPS